MLCKRATGPLSLMNIWILAIFVFVFNLPFGYWRASVRKFSLAWIAAIHSPVPFVIALRIVSGLGWQLLTFPLIASAFFGGQFVGGKIYIWRKRRSGSVN